MNCPKCQEKMELGFVLDQSHATAFMPVWYSGPFKRSFWGSLGLGKRKSYYVQTMRCTACGYLESYAK